MRPAIQVLMVIAASQAFDNGAGLREDGMRNAALVVFNHSEHRESGHAVLLEWPYPG